MKTFRRRADELVLTHSKRPPQLFVGGLDVESDSHTSTPIHAPATSELLGRCPSASPADVDRAVAAARKAARELRHASAETRRDRLARLARYLENEAEDLMVLHCLETGRSVRHVRRHDVEASVTCIRDHAGWPSKQAGAHRALPGLSATETWVPRPVVGLVVEDRQPFAQLVRGAAPLWAAGSAVVAVVPERAPLAALRLAQLVHDAGFPPGAFNLLSGATPAIEALAAHPDVDGLWAATGIDRARRLHVLAAKSNLKPVRADTGGRTTAVIFDDASLGRACRVAAHMGLGTASLDGFGLQRLFVHRPVYEEVASLVTHKARALVVADPLDEHSELGAVPHEAWMKRTLAYAQLGRREGATLVAGGARHVDGSAAEGFFVAPTVLIEGRPEMRVTREDAGGPLLVMVPFEREDEVVERVNDLEHDAGVSIWTASAERLQRLAKHLDRCTIWLNGHGGSHPALAHGGRGLGGDHRTGGRPGLEQFVLPKTVVVPDPET
ncbi:MAG TPA: aldehyde dehydrogenase family protein [Myxococcales bacterium LLY-WYZ-16_1]|jgi:phenylacetaldehyde dehydrogenase|nr:aldehyde dehydrogenase family protein [Myxococcales bacterium LLY-WYZ-16_1]